MPTITGHAGLARNTSGDDDNLGVLEGIGKAGGSGLVAGDLFFCMSVHHLQVAFNSVVPRSWC